MPRRLLSLDGVKIGVMLVRRTLVGASLVVLSLGATGCGLAGQQQPDEPLPRAERFEFVIQPADLEANEVRERLEDNGLNDHEIIDAIHLAWVEGSSGRVDFYQYNGISQSPTLPGPVSCHATVDPGSGDSASCGAGFDRPDTPTSPLEITGRAGDRFYETAELAVSDDVAVIFGTTEDGTKYRIEPLDGVGWVEWTGNRGMMTLTATDEDGNVLKQLAAIVYGPR